MPAFAQTGAWTGPVAPTAVAPALTLTIVSLTIAYARHATLERIAATIRGADADVVALQEVDRFTRRQPVDQATRLGELLGMQVAYAPAISYQGGEFGVAVLSRLPITGVAVHKLPVLDVQTLPGPARLLFGCRRDDIEQRVLLIETLETAASGVPITVATTHLGLCGDRERLPQARGIAVHATRLDVLAGDFNARPSALAASVAGVLEAAGLTIGAANGVDWIAAPSCNQLVSSRTLTERVSDHRAITATFRFACDRSRPSGAE